MNNVLDVIRLSADDVARERRPGIDEDVHFPEALAEAVLREFSHPGDRILDPFAGYGTTLAVSERLRPPRQSADRIRQP